MADLSPSLLALRLSRPLTAREGDALTALLPPARRARLLEGPHRGREEVLCAYGLLGYALRIALGWTALPPVALAPGGRPFFPACPQVCFSLSHTPGAVLAGLAPRPLGVDIQLLRPVAPAALRRIPEAADGEDFLRLFVRREARSKLRGTPLAAMLRREPPMEPGEVYQALTPFPGYLAGAALREGPVPALGYVDMEQIL